MQTRTIPSLVRHRDEGDYTWFFNGLMTRVAGTAETGGAFSVCEYLVTSACNPPMHVQADEEEAFYILEGEVEFEVDGQLFTATPGTFAMVARGAPHRYEVLTPTARMLVICSGKASENLEDFFFAMGEPATERALPVPALPDGERLAELCQRTGIELV